ncbi:509_t:CDS:1, partial [Funneliformis geosporum]
QVIFILRNYNWDRCYNNGIGIGFDYKLAFYWKHKEVEYGNI